MNIRITDFVKEITEDKEELAEFINGLGKEMKDDFEYTESLISIVNRLSKYGDLFICDLAEYITLRNKSERG